MSEALGLTKHALALRCGVAQAMGAGELGAIACLPLAKTLGHARIAPPEPALRRLRLVADADDELDTTILEREFPTVAIQRSHRHEPGDLVIDDFAWRGAFEFGRFDEALAATPLAPLVVRGADAAGVGVEVMARYQRLILRRNEASSTSLFDAVLHVHARLFDEAVPSARLDHEHALDAWQWMLRLDPLAGLVPQLAALFHDVDRLGLEPQERLEHRARRLLDPSDPARDAGWAREPRRPASLVHATLRSAGVERVEAERVCDLACGTSLLEREATLLDDADGLSFLSLMTAPYADYFGLAQMRRKVTFTLNRLGNAARSKVALLRLRPDVHRLLQPG